VVTDANAIADLLQRGLVDWVSLHDVVWYGTHGCLSPESKDRVLRVLKHLFNEGLMVPGDLGDSGFEDWVPPISLWPNRAVDELDRFDWAPMGDGFWLRLTERGWQAAEERL
jgi:hypothetical protein